MTGAVESGAVAVREPVVSLAGAAESLLLPLFSRAFESCRDQPLLRDLKAIELTGRLEFDASALSRNRLYHTIICIRTRYFDAAVEEFLRLNPTGIVVNLGCGLDTRFERVDNGTARWVEVDFPEVIELRRKLLPESDRRKFVGCSITDHAWLDAVDASETTPVFFFAEGVFMFLPPNAARELITQIGQRFAGSTLMFDAVKPIEVLLRRYHPTLRRTQALLRWGLSGAAEIERWDPAFRLDNEWFYCEEAEPRLGWYRLLRYVPWLGRTAWILRFKIEPT